MHSQLDLHWPTRQKMPPNWLFLHHGWTKWVVDRLLAVYSVYIFLIYFYYTWFYQHPHLHLYANKQYYHFNNVSLNFILQSSLFSCGDDNIKRVSSSIRFLLNNNSGLLYHNLKHISWCLLIASNICNHCHLGVYIYCRFQEGRGGCCDFCLLAPYHSFHFLTSYILMLLSMWDI